MSLLFPLSGNDCSLCHCTLIVDVDAGYPVFYTFSRTDYSNILAAEVSLIVLVDPGRMPEIRRTSVDDALGCRLWCMSYRSRRSEIADTISDFSEQYWSLRCSELTSRRANSSVGRETIPRRLRVPHYCFFLQRTVRSRLQIYVAPLKSELSHTEKPKSEQHTASSMHNFVNYLLIAVLVGRKITKEFKVLFKELRRRSLKSLRYLWRKKY